MRKRVGDFLKDKGLLTDQEVVRILEYSQTAGVRFGDAGLQLGLLTPEALMQVFGPNYDVDFFYIEPGLFPRTTRELLSVDEVVRLGVLPLGFKTEGWLLGSKRLLNLGMLDPSRKDAAQAALDAARTRPGGIGIQGTKIYLVLPDQFMAVLDGVYGMDEARLERTEPSAIDLTLRYFVRTGHNAASF